MSRDLEKNLGNKNGGTDVPPQLDGGSDFNLVGGTRFVDEFAKVFNFRERYHASDFHLKESKVDALDSTFAYRRRGMMSRGEPDFHRRDLNLLCRSTGDFFDFANA